MAQNPLILVGFPGANASLRRHEGQRVILSKELRDTTGNWFYWSFAARFTQPGTYEFVFDNGPAIGTQGPAVSVDGGRTWVWLGASSFFTVPEGEGFAYAAAGQGETVHFCLGMQYLQSHWQDFLASRSLRDQALCTSRHGRRVELLELGEGEETVVVASRHHCCEMAATYTLQGLLEAALDTPEFLRRYRILAVPFVDKDGVEEGDQGKNRHPHDHARDYGDTPIYPEVAAIQELIRRHRAAWVLDLHCPWLRGYPYNETVYWVGSSLPDIVRQAETFNLRLQACSSPEMPYQVSDNVLFGTAWNTAANYTQGKTMARWAGELPWSPNAFSYEIPYANCREVVLGPASWRRLGAAMLQAINGETAGA